MENNRVTVLGTRQSIDFRQQQPCSWKLHAPDIRQFGSQYMQIGLKTLWPGFHLPERGRGRGHLSQPKVS